MDVLLKNYFGPFTEKVKTMENNMDKKIVMIEGNDIDNILEKNINNSIITRFNISKPYESIENFYYQKFNNLLNKKYVLFKLEIKSIYEKNKSDGNEFINKIMEDIRILENGIIDDNETFVEKLKHNYHLMHYSLKYISPKDIERLCENASIKWVNNNCAFDSFMMMILFPIHHYTFMKLIYNPISAKTDLTRQIVKLYNDINNPKQKTTCDMFRSKLHKYFPESVSQKNQYQDADRFLDIFEKEYDYNFFKSVITRTGTGKTTTNELIQQRLKTLIDDKKKFVRNKDIDTEIKKKFKMRGEINKIHILTKTKLDNLNNGIYFVVFQNINYLEVGIDSYLKIPDFVRYYISNEDIYFKLSGVTFIKHGHWQSFINCHDTWYLYNGASREIDVGTFRKCGDINNTKNRQLLTGTNKCIFYYTSISKLPILDLLAIKHQIKKK